MRADLYGLGCVLYELLIGRPPFTTAGSVYALMHQHLDVPPAPPRDQRPDRRGVASAGRLRGDAVRPRSAVMTGRTLRDAALASIGVVDHVGATAVRLAGWRREVAGLYARVRAEPDPPRAHRLWQDGRDALFRGHPSSPLRPDDPLRRTGLPYFRYDPALRFEAPLSPAEDAELTVNSSSDGEIRLRRAGVVHLPAPVPASLDVWWLDQYAGGIFLPVRDATAGAGSYGGGRYLLDTAKGADLGGPDGALVLDLNFLYHPSCRYDPSWSCPLAPAGNTLTAPIRAGERL